MPSHASPAKNIPLTFMGFRFINFIISVNRYTKFFATFLSPLKPKVNPPSTAAITTKKADGRNSYSKFSRPEGMIMNLLTTLKGSLLESFFPPAWDLAAFDACIDDDPKAILVRPPHWHADFSVRMVDNVEDFNVMLGHELAMEIRRCRRRGAN